MEPSIDATRPGRNGLDRAPRVALVHDDLTQRGGAERVVLALSRMFPGAPVFTTVYDPEGTYAEFADLDVHTTALQRAPHSGNAGRALLPLYPWAIGRIRIEGYDLVVSSSSRFAHGVDAAGATHVTYCHNPPRWLYQTDEYLRDGGPVPRVARPAVRALLPLLRRWDQRAARRPDRYVANSRLVAARIASIYGREASVVYPPISPDRFLPADPLDLGEPYFLVISRLLPYKRVDLVVEACAALGTRLVVVGAGPAEASLRALAGPRCKFRSGVDDGELRGLLAGCVALVQPGFEDFGLTPLEANAAGRPVVAFGAGGALESVVHGVTGLHFGEQSVAALQDALRRVQAKDWRPESLRRYAEVASEGRFRRDMGKVFSSALADRSPAGASEVEAPR